MNTITNLGNNKSKPEVWGGMECTINRVLDQYFDQFERTGQYSQIEDLQKVCNLGISKVRFPILWERHHNNPSAWEHTSKQLDLLDSNSVTPIAGLLHHGSGPSFTNLADRAFPELLAAYAIEVATAFPWIKYYTPVNEPLTTARFSGLYGYWYPHATDDRTFAVIFINQLKGIVLSMQAIRKINPDAQLIQTEDLCKVHSTAPLQYQADFENGRRWWTYDFLTSKVTKAHNAWSYFIEAGVDESDLRFFLENPCVPAIAGFNYYITSERYLDDNLNSYPAHLTGGNGRDMYADTEAVRSGHVEGLEVLMTEAWIRLHIPMALTECHLSCTREQQLRWLDRQWRIINDLNENSIPVVAITIWALVGAYDWNSLVTKKEGYYESGAFNVASGITQPTALCDMIRAMSENREFSHPVLAGRGWWDGDREEKHPYVKNIIAIDAPFILPYCSERSLHVVAITDTSVLSEMVCSRDAWAVVSGVPNEDVERICNGLNIPFLFIDCVADINEMLDSLIDIEATACIKMG